MPDLMARALLPLLILLALQQLGSAGLIKAKAGLAPLMLAKAWEQSLASEGRPVKPWPWADTWPVAKLQVPSMGISQFVLAGDTGNALAFGPGHNLASAALGAAGPAMIGGHRDTHFQFLQHLRKGQRIVLQLPDGLLRHYRVKQMTVDTASGDMLWPNVGEQLLLVTCYPFDAFVTGGSERFVVTAEPESLPLLTLDALGGEPQRILL